MTSKDRVAVLARFIRNQVSLGDRPPVGCIQLNNEEASLCAGALEQNELLRAALKDAHESIDDLLEDIQMDGLHGRYWYFKAEVLEGDLRDALRLCGETEPKHRFTAEAKEGYCIHCSRVMGEHSKGNLYCPETARSPLFCECGCVAPAPGTPCAGCGALYTPK